MATRNSPASAWHGIVVVTFEMVMSCVFALPRYRALNRVKSAFLRLMGARVGRHVTYYPGVWITPARDLVIGDHVDLARGVIVTTGGGVEIGDRVLIGYRTQILSANHVIPPRPQRIFDSGHNRARVVIGNDVWIGANCLILPGVTIGEGAVIAAGSAVTKSVEPFAIVAGVPARTVRMRE